MKRPPVPVTDGPGVPKGGGADPALYFGSASPDYRKLLAKADRAAASGRPVLLCGETGTGKSELARRIHAKSPRASAPFVTVNCPALSASLVGSTLFGHTRGAFTGAVGDTIGQVQEARGGTLFFDELADLVMETQVCILLFLQDGTYRRVGESREHRADVRLVAATNRALKEEVRAGRFREDLFFRLNVLTLTLPPLRARREDVLPLAHHFLAAASHLRGEPLAFSPAAERAIQAHPWPGNLRELQHAVERAAALTEGAIIGPADLELDGDPEPAPEPVPSGAPTTIRPGEYVTLATMEREHIKRVLARVRSLAQAARILQIDRTTLARKCRLYGLR
jgi:NtrC-family two-component system response regulator AlgB